jgi:hypothetical protein
MRVLTEDAYTWATESSPNGNGDEDVAVRAEMDAPDSGVSPDGGAAGFSELKKFETQQQLTSSLLF